MSPVNVPRALKKRNEKKKEEIQPGVTFLNVIASDFFFFFLFSFFFYFSFSLNVRIPVFFCTRSPNFLHLEIESIRSVVLLLSRKMLCLYEEI